MSNIAYLAKNPTKQKICTDRWIFVHEELDIVTYLLHTTTFDPFWSTLGSNWGQKSKKLAIQLKKFAWVDHFLPKQKDYPFKEFMIVRSWAKCYREHNSSN